MEKYSGFEHGTWFMAYFLALPFFRLADTWILGFSAEHVDRVPAGGVMQPHWPGRQHLSPA